MGSVASCDLEEVLYGISERLRVVVVLRYWQGLTGPEIAQLRGVPIGTVKRGLFDAMTLMRRALNARA